MRVLIITFNRLLLPLRVADWVAARGCEPVFVDNNSTYLPLLDYYKTTPYQVIRVPVNLGHTVVWQDGFLDRHGVEGRYIVTDPDLDLSGVPDDFLQVMNEGLDRYQGYDKCGLSLEIGDLPNTAEARLVRDVYEAKYWERPLDKRYFHADTDTTFALYRARHYSHSGIRTNRPYTARHIPWYYRCFENLSEEEKYYYSTADASSSGKTRLIGGSKNEI